MRAVQVWYNDVFAQVSEISSNREKFCSARKEIRGNIGAKLRTFLDIKSKYLYYIILLFNY